MGLDAWDRGDWTLSEIARKKAGGIRVPNGSDKAIIAVITKAFENMEKTLDAEKIKLKPVFVRELGSFKDELSEELSDMVSVWVKVTNALYGKHVTLSDAKKEFTEEVDQAFAHIKSLAKDLNVVFNEDVSMIFWRLHRDIRRGGNRLISKWM